jgi:hypothetical protein
MNNESVLLTAKIRVRVRDPGESIQIVRWGINNGSMLDARSRGLIAHGPGASTPALAVAQLDYLVPHAGHRPCRLSSRLLFPYGFRFTLAP